MLAERTTNYESDMRSWRGFELHKGSVASGEDANDRNSYGDVAFG
jgi:hypothetical protein